MSEHGRKMNPEPDKKQIIEPDISSNTGTDVKRNGTPIAVSVILAIMVISAELLFLFLTVRGKRNYEYFQVYGADRIESAQDGSLIRSPEEKLRKGIYEITVEVMTDAANGEETVVGFETGKGLDNEEISVFSPGRTVIFRGYVTAADNRSYVSVAKKDGIDVQVKRIQIGYLPAESARTALIAYAAFFVLCDALLCALIFCRTADLSQERRKIRNLCLTFLFVLVTGMFVSIPLIKGGVYFSHDFKFHLNRIYGLEQGLSTQFPVRIQPFWMNGYGYPVGVCYGDLLLYIPALLHLAGFPLRIVYKGYLLFINVLTAGIATYSFGKIAGNQNTGKICGFLYTASLWRLVDLYNRSALGEYSAIAFLPFLALGFWYLFRDQPDRKKAFFCLTAGFTGIIQTHVLSCAMAGIFTVLLCVLEIPNVFRKKRFRTLLCSAAAVLLLNAGFLVPFLDYYFTVPLSLAEIEKEYIQTYGARLKELIPFRMYPAAWGGPSTAEVRFTTTVGLALLIVLCVAMVLAAGIAKISLLALLSVWMSTHYFPYDAIQEKLPALFKVIGVVQYPWRYFTAALVLCAFLAAKVLSGLKERRVLMAGLCILLITVSAGQAYVYQRKHMQDGLLYKMMDVVQLDGFYDLEYRLRGTDIYDTSPEIIRSDGIELYGSEREGMNFVITVQNSGTQEGYLELPVLAYKGFAAKTQNGKLAVEKGSNNRLKISVPAGFSGEIFTGFAEPWYWRTAEFTSLVTFAVLVYVILHNRKSRSERRKDQLFTVVSE